MTEPIKSGDECVVVGGALEGKGPNLGKRVTVKQLRGEHSVHGRIWRCTGPDIVTEYGAIGGEADFAQAWLQKADPLPPTTVNTHQEREHS